MADAESSCTDTSLALTTSATTQTSFLDSALALDDTPDPSARSSKNDRRTSLGLIDAARMRLSMDLHSLLRSNSKSQRTRTVLSSQAEDPENQLLYPNYAKVASHIVDLEVHDMDGTVEERTGRGLGARIVDFLSRSRSRSRSRKRRSRSLDAYPADPMPSNIHTASLRVHARHSSLEDEHDAGVAGPSRPATRIPSRPISNTTTATNTTVKPRSKRPEQIIVPASTPLPSATAELVAQLVPIEQTQSSSSRKGKRINIFGILLPSPRKGSFSESARGRSRPTSPSPAISSTPDHLWQGHDGRAWTDKSGSQRSQKSIRKGLPVRPVESTAQCLTSCVSPEGGRSAALPGLVAPQPRPVPIHLLPVNRDQFMAGHPDADLQSVEGRCSPLCGLGTSSKGSQTSRETTREKERIRGSRDRSTERGRDKKEKEREKVREKEKERITHPRRVGSPVQRVRESTSAVVVAAVPMEKTSSGRSANSRRSASRDHHGHPRSGAEGLAARTNRIKHGSFDFERPVSSGIAAGGGGITIRTALRNMGIGDAERLQPLQRSNSARAVPARKPTDQSTESDFAPSSLPNTRPVPDKGKKAAFDVHFANPPSRRPVDNSISTPAYPHTHSASHSHSHSHSHSQSHSHSHSQSHSHSGRGHQIATTTAQSNPTPGHRREPVPPSPMSSASGDSSGPARDGSWGRSAGKRVARGSHGLFKFEPAVPPIPGSPADTPRRPPAAAARPSSPSPLPSSGANSHTHASKAQQARYAGKGRSLDLGLGLTWAPSRVREEAVLRPRAGASTNGALRARSRWRGADADEEGRLTAGAASDVAEAFKEALGDSAYAIFKNYVHRFDANAIPLDGPYGLLVHVERLLDSAGVDYRRKRILLERLLRVVQDSETR